MKKIRFKAACAGDFEHLRYSENYVSNSRWIASRKLFADLPADALLVRAASGSKEPKPWEKNCVAMKLPDKQMTGKVPAEGRVQYTRTPLVWEYGAGPNRDAVCFVAGSGARLWVRRDYADAFDVTVVLGHGTEDPCALSQGGEDVLVLAPCKPPVDAGAVCVLAPPRATRRKSPSERAVEQSLPDPRAVAEAAASPSGAPAEEKVPTGLCEAVGCDLPKVGTLWCARHTAPRGPISNEDFI